MGACCSSSGGQTSATKTMSGTTTTNPASGTSSSKPHPFQTAGVSLSFVTKFVEDNGGRDAFTTLKTSEVNNKYVMPDTAAAKCSYYDLLVSENRLEEVGQADIFISHTWTDIFLDVLDAITDHVHNNKSTNPKPILWMDIFCVNQHREGELDSDWLKNALKANIEKIHNTLLIVHPAVLKRAWCLWEVYHSVSTKSRFAIAMSPTNQQQLVEDMDKEGAQKALKRMLAAIDAANSRATKLQDQQQILGVVQETVGFEQVNTMVVGAVRTALPPVLLAMVANETEPMKAASLKNHLASLYQGQGRYDGAERLRIEVLATTKEMLGDRAPLTLIAMGNLGVLYSLQRRFALAVPMLKECLALMKDVLGDKHPDTLITMKSLAGVYRRQGLFELADPLLKVYFDETKEIRLDDVYAVDEFVQGEH